MNLLAVHDKTFSDILALVESVCFGNPVVYEKFESVKMNVRMDDLGRLRFARNKSHYRVGGLQKEAFLNTIQDDTVSCALHESIVFLNEIADESWPFHPGSNSWILCEVIHPEIGFVKNNDNKVIVVNEATRINWKGKKEKSKLSERLKTAWLKQVTQAHTNSFSIRHAEHVTLKNLSGLGIYNRLKAVLEHRLVSLGLGFDNTVHDYAQAHIAHPSFSSSMSDINTRKIIAALRKGTAFNFNRIPRRLMQEALDEVNEAVQRAVDEILHANHEMLSCEPLFHAGLIVEDDSRRYALVGRYAREKKKILNEKKQKQMKRNSDVYKCSRAFPFIK